jgi:hypothetical protein
MIFRAFSSPFSGGYDRRHGIDEAPAINDCPAKLIWSYS